MEKPVFVLGFCDLEMEMICSLLEEAKEHYVWATHDGAKVNAKTAYLADGSVPELPERHPVILVECGGKIEKQFRIVKRIDHHKQRDPGYRFPPWKFMSASSIGKVNLLLHEIKLGAKCRYVFKHDVWKIEYAQSSCSCCPPKKVRLDVPQNIVLCSAADHCLTAAYQGECPGIDPDELFEWRVEKRGAYQNRSVEAIKQDIQNARIALERAPTIAIDNVVVRDMRPGRGAPCGEHGASCHGDEPTCWGDVRELPEAAARYGIPFIGVPKFTSKHGKKCVIQAAPPNVIEAVLEGRFDGVELENVYGNPNRGFAGGYVTH